MGCWYSRLEREELVSRCKARKKYMKQLVKSRQAFSASHSMYLRSLRNTGSALLQFATGETDLHPHNHHLPPLPPSPPRRVTAPQPPPPPPMSPTSWTTSTNTTTSSALPPPPPPPPSPPPPPPAASNWDFWDPFVPPPSSSRSVTEEEWDETTVTSEVAVTATVGAASVAAPPSVVSQFSKETTSTSELAVVVSTKGKDLVEIIKELDEYFLNAADAGGQLSLLLEVPNCAFSEQRSSDKLMSPFSWSFGGSSRWNGIGRFCDDPMNKSINGANGTKAASHCSTVERLHAWEKKLYLEVKHAEALKLEHEKRGANARKLEMKRADYVKTEKAKKEVEKLDSQMMVASQAIETTSAEIIKIKGVRALSTTR